MCLFFVPLCCLGTTWLINFDPLWTSNLWSGNLLHQTQPFQFHILTRERLNLVIEFSPRFENSGHGGGLEEVDEPSVGLLSAI